ncbi:hypothetical protein EON65_51965 [archaeon]|nr:MAG: hypothetical protein EON65_51965 [archaeon]
MRLSKQVGLTTNVSQHKYHLLSYNHCLGYGQAMVNVGNGREVLQKDYRNSARCLMDDEKRAYELWLRIKHFVPKKLRNFQQFTPVELNERLRFLR